MAHHGSIVAFVYVISQVVQFPAEDRPDILDRVADKICHRELLILGWLCIFLHGRYRLGWVVSLLFQLEGFGIWIAYVLCEETAQVLLNLIRGFRRSALVKIQDFSGRRYGLRLSGTRGLEFDRR